MITVEKIQVAGIDSAIRGMRNPMNSWDRSDSGFIKKKGIVIDGVVGQEDMRLMQNLFQAGTEHRKYLRQVVVWMDITAPLYWWKEFDTYKIGTVANSCSTMHKIHEKEFTLDDFSHEHLLNVGTSLLEKTIEVLNLWRNVYIKGNMIYPKKSKEIWWQMIQSLPSSYNQKRTVMMNYEVCATIIKQRTGHKLTEWKDFVDVLKGLPYLNKIMEGAKDE